MSTVTGNVVLRAIEKYPQYEGHQVASALAIICGAIVCFLGLIRLGWLVDFISLTAISAFMTGSALNIAAGQVPGMMGISGFSTRESTYKVIINTLKHLGRTNLDATVGLTALVMLYLIRGVCTYAAKKYPSKAKLFFFLSTLRTVFVILLYTLIGFLVNRNHRGVNERKFKLLGSVPRGKKLALNHPLLDAYNEQVFSMLLSPLSTKTSSPRLPPTCLRPLSSFSSSTSLSRSPSVA